MNLGRCILVRKKREPHVRACRRSLDDREQLERHAARSFGAGLPLLDRTLASVEVAGEYRLTDVVGLADLLDFAGFISLGTTKCLASKRRIVVLSSVPTLWSIAAEGGSPRKYRSWTSYFFVAMTRGFHQL